MVTKLCQPTTNANDVKTSLTVTGAGGFGKTSIVIALCHHPVIKEQFKDGVVFIELGPQASDPRMKLKGIYMLLTDKPCDINVVEQQVYQLTSRYFHNLLVIIDDVWYVEDAEPIVKAFSNCKIVLTTRMNDIERCIPTKHVVSVGPMEQSEAISLLTSGVIDISQLSHEDVNLLDELAQDVHLWPLLLSLVRGQLSHNLKEHKHSFQNAIQCVQANMLKKGLMAFDKNNITKSRKYAVKACIDATLDLLKAPLSSKMKSLILWNGIGNTVQTGVLHTLWKTTEADAKSIVDNLWTYGLVQFTNILIPPHKVQICVEVHAVISHYIIESMDSLEVYNLSPLKTLGDGESISEELVQKVESYYGSQDGVPQSYEDYLMYKKSVLENLSVPFYLKWINMWTILDPHIIMLILKYTQEALRALPNNTIIPSSDSVFDKFTSLSKECCEVLNDAHKLSRKLNQSIQRCLGENNYENLVQTILTYVEKYPTGSIAKEAATLVDQVRTYGNINLPSDASQWLEYLHLLTPTYHHIGLVIVPRIKLYLNQLQRIIFSLQSGSQEIEQTYNYFMSSDFKEEDSYLVVVNYFFRIREVAPSWVDQRIASYNQM